MVFLIMANERFECEIRSGNEGSLIVIKTTKGILSWVSLRKKDLFPVPLADFCSRFPVSTPEKLQNHLIIVWSLS